MGYKYEVETIMRNGDLVVRPFKVKLFADIYARRMYKQDNVKKVKIGFRERRVR